MENNINKGEQNSVAEASAEMMSSSPATETENNTNGYNQHTHEIGNFTEGTIDLQNGNLELQTELFSWLGNRMPVTLRLLYNSAKSDFEYLAPTADTEGRETRIGKGFKLNLMQYIRAAYFTHEDTSYLGYIYTDENGKEIKLKPTSDTSVFEDVNSDGITYNLSDKTLEIGGGNYRFTDNGVLCSISDEHGSMTLMVVGNRIMSIIDGAGRAFVFSYNEDGYLASITAPDSTSVQFTYENGRLSYITHPDGSYTIFTYTESGKPSCVDIRKPNGSMVYRVAYTFNGNAVASVTEYGYENGNEVSGASAQYSYSANGKKTTVTVTEPADNGEEATVTTTVYTFDDDGEIAGQTIQINSGEVMLVNGGGAGINPFANGNIGVLRNSRNYLARHDFTSLTGWIMCDGNDATFVAEKRTDKGMAMHGGSFVKLTGENSEAVNNGIYQTSITLPEGDNCFSAYVKVTSDFEGTDAGAFIRVSSGNTVIAKSEIISKPSSDYIRLVAPFKLAVEKEVKVEILTNGKGTVYVDSAQLEHNSYATTYNQLYGGSMENPSQGWKPQSGTVTRTDEQSLDGGYSLRLDSAADSGAIATMNAYIVGDRDTRETLTLSGWAKASASPDATFRLRGVLYYTSPANEEPITEEFIADFDKTNEDWQFVSCEIAKSKFRTLNMLKVCCEYGNTEGSAYFDDIQLTRDSIEKDLTAEDFIVPEETDEDETNETEAETEETAEETIPDFEEVLDEFGNALTETTFTDGEFGTIYRSFGYANGANDLVRETDARGNKTEYTVNAVTSRNDVVTDRIGNKTAYEYDTLGRTTKVTSIAVHSVDNVEEELANVSYSYDTFNNLDEIVRGDGLKYVLNYNPFHNLESIGINGKTENLVAYSYKNGNGRLKSVTYANGHVMRASYNTLGQMVAEKWFENETASTPIAHYKYVYDNDGNIVRTIDILSLKDYTYTYEEGKLVRSAESRITLDNEMVVAKTLLCSVIYSYDNEDNLTSKRIIFADGSEQTIHYENSEDGNPVVKLSVNGKTVTSHSKNDSFGRKEFDELQIGKGFVSRKFAYHAGEVTEEHKNAEKVKSSPTTQLVSQIVLSDESTLSYSYDNEERITQVIYVLADGNTTTTKYTYDALGQLVTETVNGDVVNSMEYDNYGNITKKNGFEYAYDETWKDLLVRCGDSIITYDAQGNPVNYFNYNLTWEKGRQLKSFDDVTYTYNANGIRTSKTVGDATHNYTLDGTKILREEWNGNTLITLYDNEDTVCGIIYNNEPYYFLKNLQGDIIGIVNKDSEVVARYTYDAWGACTSVDDTTEIGIGFINPYRYRGYYYDEDTLLYYLQSRYYDPLTGRFINGDEVSIALTMHEFNIFVYCSNDAVDFIDPFGYYAGQKKKGQYGGIYDPKAYLKDRYGGTISLANAKILFLDSSEMSSFGEGNICTKVAIAKILQYYSSMYSGLPYSAVRIFKTVSSFDSHDYTDPWYIDNLAKKTLKYYGYKKARCWNVYVWTFDNEVKKEIDNGFPVIFNIARGYYGNHSVTVIGYKIYTVQKKKGNKTSKTKYPMIAIYDGWSRKIMYIDYNAFALDLEHAGFGSFTKIRVEK